MSVVAQIDAQLAHFAAAQRTVLTRDRHGQSLRSWGANNPGFKERRIDWQREGMNLAVIIQPDFGGISIDTRKWHFYALAWQNVAGGRRTAELRLGSGAPFAEIEARVAELLATAGTYLNALQPHDLQRRMFG